MITPLPKLNYAHSILIQEENQWMIAGTIMSDLHDTQFSGSTTSAAVSGNFSKNKKDWICTYCGKKGHKVDKCWNKYGV